MTQKTFCPNGTQHITDAINTAIASGERTATISGNWEIDTAIRIPSDFTLVLDGCHLKLADGCFSNVFVNEHHDTPIGKTPNGTDRNITIEGKNGAIIDGGKYNGLSEKIRPKTGWPPIWKNNLILFTNVENFEISGISFHNQRWWALNFIYCSYGKLHDIDFKACDIYIDKNGNEGHGLVHSSKYEVLVKNADGIDLREGCHDIIIENITGFTEDDSIALTGLRGRMEREFAVEGFSSDICNITIKNIKTAAFCANVRLLSQGEVKLHDISVDGVYDASENSPHMDRGLYAVRIGDARLYGERHATNEETYNIKVKNVSSRALIAAVGLAGGMGNVSIENIECYGDTREIEDKRGI